jgi:predicted AlkP superfamily phosphohydrolase/phosphomutase
MNLQLVLLALLAPLATARTSEPSVTTSAASAQGRVIVLGFDGADGRTVAEMMDKGELPNLAKLRAEGTFAPLGTTDPAESPVAWASLNSGRNPAETAIPGFVVRTFSPVPAIGDNPFKGKLGPSPTKGFAEDGVQVPIEELPTPIPSWSPLAFAAAVGGGGFLVFLLVFGALLRLKARPTLVLSGLLGLVGAWGGFTLRGYLPDTIPVVKNPLQAAPFWELAAQAGVPSRVIDGQQVWDREPVSGAKVLCGLGVPDARGSYMNYTIYTSDELFFGRTLLDAGVDTGSGGYKLRVDEVDGVIESVVYGPMNFWAVGAQQEELAAIARERDEQPNMPFKKSMELEDRAQALETALKTPITLPLRVRRLDNAAEVAIGTQTQTIAEGAWSDWFRLTFEINPLLKVHALTRAKVVSLREPNFELYLNTIEIDPARPPFWQPISQPPEFAAELATACGSFETVGWACLTHPFKDKVVDAVTFLQDIEFTTQWREKLVYDGLAREDWRLFVGIFSECDRVQHMMYQYYDPEHPLYDAEKAATKVRFYGEEITLAQAIPAVFRKIDAIVGKVLAQYVRPDDTLILCADHGFQSFRHQVHLNNWLAQEGYLVARPDAKSFTMLGSYVDWSKTRAYALGLGSIFINTKGARTTLGGKELVSEVGSVEPAEREALAREIIAKLKAARDPRTGELLCSEATFVSDVHSGAHQQLEADISVGFAANYRVSWATSSGSLSMKAGAPGPFVVPNDKDWSGDHVSVDTDLVRGIFFCNRRCDVPAQGMDLLHMAPTVLGLLGVPIPPELDLAPVAVTR